MQERKVQKPIKLFFLLRLSLVFTLALMLGLKFFLNASRHPTNQPRFSLLPLENLHSYAQADTNNIYGNPPGQ